MEENILVRITGEADLNDAQLQLRDMNNRGKELEQQMRNLAKAEQDDIAAVKARIAAGKEDAAELQEVIKYHKERQAALQREITTNEKSIASLKKSVSAYNAMNGAGNKLAMQIRTIREQLAQMEMSGDTSSQAFIDMSIQAAKLQDQMGDTARQIQILASDTKNLDAAMSVGSGVAGAFNVATSAAALLGGESEELQQAFLKVQAAMAILNGVQQVANTLNKDSVANVVLRTAMQKLFNKAKQQETAQTIKATAASGADAAAKGVEAGATTAATKATWSFNAALLANPVMWVVAGIMAAIAAVVALAKSFDDSADRAARMNSMLESTSRQLKQLKSDADFAARVMQAEGKTEREILDERQKVAKQALDIADANYDRMQKEYFNARKHNADMQKAMDDANQQRQEAWDEYNRLLQDGIVLDYKEKADEKKRNEDHAKELAEQRKRHAEERRKQIEEAEKQLADVRIALMDDGAKKEIAKINIDFDRKIEAIKGNSAAEIALRTALEKQRQKAIAKVNDDIAAQEREQARQLANARYANDLALAESFGGEYLYETKKEVLRKQAELEISAITESEKNEQMRAEKIMAVNNKLIADLKALEREHAASEVNDARMAAEIRVKEAENAAIAILNNENSTDEQIKAARETLANHDKNLRDIRMQEIESQYERGLITEQQFQDAKLDIEREALDAEAEMIAERTAQTQELVNNIMSFVSDMASEIFGAISDHIQQELDDLDELYTTDAEEAKENSKKKYLSEKEMEDKKLELKRKAAAVEKAEAAFNIAMNTAMAIMRIWADVPKVDFGATTIAMTAMAAALGATQLAMVLAKPLPKYAKGRKRGKGEYAMVGERGAELMYIPDNASIVPHHHLNQPEKWGDYNVPMPYVPAQPNIEREIMRYAIMQQVGFNPDYDRFGRAVAEHIIIPEQKAVYVNVDRSGIGVSEGGDYHHYLNRKYAGTWN